MEVDVADVLNDVCDERTFVAFLAALSRDFAAKRTIEASRPSSAYGQGALGWENGAVDTFLEAASAWADDTATNPLLNPAEENAWQRCAKIVYAGKFYE